MKITKLNLIVIATLAFTITVTSCRKKIHEKDEDPSDAVDHSFAEHVSNDITNIGSQSTDNNTGSLSSYRTEGTELLSCALVKRDTINHIDSVIFNNSTCLDGRTRNGILIYNYSASTNGAKHYRDPGFNCSVTSNGYSVDGKSINIISKNIINTTPVGFNPSATNLTWNITGHIQIIKTEGTHDFTFTKIKTLLNTADANVYHGSAIPISWNLARIGITGTSSGTTVKGIAYSGNVTSQLIRDFGACTISGRHPFIQGTYEFSPSGKATRYFDFGNGSCDLNATVTVNGKTHTITLP